MKGISGIIATILLVLIAISLVGVAYVFFSGMIGGRTGKTISLLDSFDNIVVISNDGTQTIQADEIKIFVNGQEATILNPQAIESHKTATLEFIPIENGNVNVKVISPSNAVSLNIENRWVLIGHNHEARTHVTGYESAGSYSATLTYDLPISSIINMLSSATEARQYLFYECKGSVLRTDGEAYGWWTSRDGTKMTYWPNGNSNCDINDGVWRQDGGYITSINELPITGLRLGDTGDSGEEGYYTIGKLWIKQ